MDYGQLGASKGQVDVSKYRVGLLPYFLAMPLAHVGLNVPSVPHVGLSDSQEGMKKVKSCRFLSLAHPFQERCPWTITTSMSLSLFFCPVELRVL